MQISFRVSAYYGPAEWNLNCYILVAFAIENATRTAIILCSLLKSFERAGSQESMHNGNDILRVKKIMFQ